MSTLKLKTWADLEAEIAHTMGLFLMPYTLESPFVGARATEKRKAGKAPQTLEQRAVTLRFTAFGHTRVVMTMLGEATALENLELLAKAVEWIRLAHVRDIEHLVVKILRQMYPEPAREAPPPPPPRVEYRDRVVGSTGPYATLHINNDAPLEVAEAAYRALARAGGHPDTGGSHEYMKRLNLAIEQIRAAQAARAGARTP